MSGNTASPGPSHHGPEGGGFLGEVASSFFSEIGKVIEDTSDLASGKAHGGGGHSSKGHSKGHGAKH